MPRVKPVITDFLVSFSFSVILVFCITAQEVQGTEIISSTVTLGDFHGPSPFSTYYSYTFENTVEELHLKITMESNITIDGDILNHSAIDVYVVDLGTLETFWERTNVSQLINIVVQLPEPKLWMITFDNKEREFDKYVTFELEIIEGGEPPTGGGEQPSSPLLWIGFAIVMAGLPGFLIGLIVFYRSRSSRTEAPRDIAASIPNERKKKVVTIPDLAIDSRSQERAEFNGVKKTIFSVLPDLNQIYGKVGIPIIEIQKKVNNKSTLVSDVLKEMIASHVIKGYIDHRQTLDDHADDLLFLESDPTYECGMCKTTQALKDPYFQCANCERYICPACHSDMRQVGLVQCPYCSSIDIKSSNNNLR
ncbi:MAG: hypothetical protein JSV04_02370 [Candidatus Heimdallarchaeota archaeon]|nr:MAG: hypothetical protein JSV04_02370 [Candidatus Heimdallarchaeota archaeon]